jgi:hypothetical protein
MVPTGLCFGNVDQANGYDAYHNIHGTKGGFIFDSYLERFAQGALLVRERDEQGVGLSAR